MACTICGCVCDDLRIVTDGQSIQAADGACELAEPWFSRLSSGQPAEPVHIHGQPAALDEGVDVAARILRGARAPLIYGLSASSTPGQRAAVRLADALGACIDTTASTCHAPSIMALQVVGESTSSLGEAKNRADLVIYWGSNPMDSHPRHIERFVESKGMFVPRGRADRQLVVVDPVRTETAELADTFLQVMPGTDFEMIAALRMLLAGKEPPIPSVGGIALKQLQQFADQRAAGRYGAGFFGLGLTRTTAPHATVEALLRLVTDLNQQTRFVVRRMRIPGDVAGADSVLCWQTGFPFSVNLARGYPRYNPGEYTANNLLERGEVDAAVMVGSSGVTQLSSAARRHLEQVPNIVLDAPDVACPIDAQVHFTTAIYGVHRRGTAYRMDETPIPLRPFLASDLPSDDEVLKAIESRL